MLKKMLISGLMILAISSSVSACEVENKGVTAEGNIITDFKPCMQESCPMYRKYRELEILIEIELGENMSDEEVQTRTARQDFVKANTRVIEPKKIVYGEVSMDVNKHLRRK